ncbi:hypothetical protein BG842_02785 [Haladaptatus sp. W1]|uniref:hypothetical protein n=1 Tax=Haladaptatus sp. W1 TaxID=1897478 RepID=UPI000849CA99|nr:hypothetical protein [Haladaptatus sp. W1]ODR80180.1 hypothetical protein BG842_02785 [Haladaptatus sp. W1]
MTNHSPRTETILGLEPTDRIQITTTNRTLTGIVYQCDHREPEFTCRGPEPGEHILYVATPTHNLYRLQYRYYDEIDHTEIKLDHYERTPNGRYSWLRTGVRIEDIITPTTGEQE